MLMKNTLLLLLLILGFNASAQYNNPYRMTFDGTNYFVTNKGNGTVSKLSSSFAHSTVITGLHSPNDIFFGSFAGNSAIVIIDSNQLKLYSPSTYGSLLKLNITGAVEAHDGVFNPNNTNEFFISDRAGNKIIKGSVGSAPFYPITYSTLTTVTKPAGMIFNSAGKLLVVTDTANAEVYEINTSTGAKTLKLSTSKDNFNDITEDGQGNYYLTCWGDNNLYRYSPTFTNAYVVATFNKPSGLLANLTYDYLGICCHNCQKVEFQFFHLFSPLADVATCPADTFYADFTPSYRGIGTYNSNNRFVVQMSDSNGSFTNPIEIGSDSTDTPPNSIKAAVPAGNYASSGYKYRLASTSPVVLSYFEKELLIKHQPKSNIFNGDTASTCIGVNLPLEVAHETNSEYTWFPPTGITTSGNGQFAFTNTANTGYYSYLFQVKDTVSGCVGFDGFVISVQPKLELTSLKDSLALCIGDTISIGVSAKPYIFKWTGSNDLTADSIANPQFFGTSSTQINVSFSDSSQTCSGKDSVYVKVNPIPPIDITQDVQTYCFGDTITFANSQVSDYLFRYSTTNELTPLLINNDTLQYLGDKAGTYFYQLTIADANTGCSKNLGNAYIVFGEVPKPVISRNTDSSTLQLNNEYKGTYTWNFRDKLSNRDTSFTTTDNAVNNPEKQNKYSEVWVEVVDSNGCLATSDKLNLNRFASVKNITTLFSVFPNPTYSAFTIEIAEPILKIEVFNLTGGLIFEQLNPSINTFNLKEIKGMYLLQITTDRGVGRKKLLFE